MIHSEPVFRMDWLIEIELSGANFNPIGFAVDQLNTVSADGTSYPGNGVLQYFENKWQFPRAGDSVFPMTGLAFRFPGTCFKNSALKGHDFRRAEPILNFRGFNP